MLSSRTKIVGGSVVYLVVAALVFAPVVRVQKAVPGRLAALVVQKPPPGFSTKPAAANTIKPSSSSFSEVKAAAKKSKDSTGAYSVEWAKTGSNDAVSMVISYLPSPPDAAKVQQEAHTAYTSSGSLKSDAYTYVGPVAVPGIPGASAAAFKASTSGNPPLVVVAFQEGRAQATVFVGLSAPPTAVESTAVSFARSEYQHLRSALSGFSLVRTTWPALSAVLYWAVAAVLLAVGLTWPAMRRRAARRRIAAAERARMQHKTVRGSKIVKRQAGRKVSR